VKVRGLANGSEANNHEVFLEELEFWESPYTVAPDAERRAGPLPAPEPKTPEELIMREARSNLWRARRDLRAHERAMAEEALAREQAEWDKAHEKRKSRELISDIEWEKADPKGQKIFGKTIDRHYVPQWKLDQMLEEGRAREEALREGIKAEQARRQKDEEEAALAAALVRQEELRQRVEKAHKTVDLLPGPVSSYHRRAYQRKPVEQLEQPVSMAHSPTNIAVLKQDIITLLKRSAPAMLHIDEISRALGCHPDLMAKVVEEMLRDNQIEGVSKP
jgi:hypothetical protein